MSEAPLTLITGLPRSGTTLTVALLNQQPNCIALAEPLPLGKMPQDPLEFSRAIDVFAEDMRNSAIHDRTIVTKAIDGRVSGNFVTEKDSGNGLRKSLAKNSAISIDKDITADFRLYIKHPAVFTALAGALSARFPLYACIRSPLAVLASWQTVDMPINRGRVPMAERFSPDLATLLDATPDTLDRQVMIMYWFLHAYRALPPECILRFEDLVHDPSGALSHICPGAIVAQPKYETQDLAKRYPSVDIDRLRRALAPIEDAIRYYYPEGIPG